MLVCVTYCAMGLALLAMCMSLIQVKSVSLCCLAITVICSAYMQEGLAIKAERMKKKITGGKKKVEIDEIKVTIHPRIISYDVEEKTR